MKIIEYPSANHSARPEGATITLLIIHADAGQTDAGTIAWIQNPESKVSYHLLVGRDGTLYRFVEDDRKAWHAGVSSFDGVDNCNDYSLGVSFANNQKGEPFTEDAIEAGVKLCAHLCCAHSIPVERITTHAIVSPGRKVDPGPLFDFDGFVARVKAAMP